MEEKKKIPPVKKMLREKLNDEDLEYLDPEIALEKQYYENSVIIKVRDSDRLIEDIATCFSIEETMEYLMLAPLEFLSRTDGIENEREYKDKLWKQVRNFYISAREILNGRYRL
ncbi:MAG: hypothetical protein K2P14_10320 [Anaeroplasmataceae bacterium]|nr:hypothetical protein [Anaeroplasmataceae bacterium]